MQNYVKIKSGTYRSSPLKDMIFPLIKPISYGKRGAFVTVDASAVMNPDYKKIRVLVNGPLDLEPSNKEDYEKLGFNDSSEKILSNLRLKRKKLLNRQ